VHHDVVPESRQDSRRRAWGWSWIALTSSLALHVLDEAANDFLSVYNPAVRAIRARLPFLPLPAFTFRAWLAGLIAAVLVLACLTPLAFRGNAGLRYLAYPYAVLMFGNGSLHILASITRGSLMPGVHSSPLLLASSVWLFRTTRGVSKWLSRSDLTL
jgi:hypothetical protein